MNGARLRSAGQYSRTVRLYHSMYVQQHGSGRWKRGVWGIGNGGMADSPTRRPLAPPTMNRIVTVHTALSSKTVSSRQDRHGGVLVVTGQVEARVERALDGW